MYFGSRVRYAERRRKKEIKRIDILDCVGNELEPGMIVAYSAGAKLKFGVYEGVVIAGEGKDRTYRVQLCQARGMKVRRNVLGYLKYDAQNDEYSAPENLVVIKNPLYHLDNSDIASCLQAIDLLKDEGHLPKDFKSK